MFMTLLCRITKVLRMNEFNLYNIEWENTFEKYNNKKKDNSITPEFISSLKREARYIRRCMLKIVRANKDIKFKATQYDFMGGYYCKM